MLDRSAYRASQGFALPTVVVVSVLLLTILTAAVGASSSIYSSLNSQYYDQLAREASESGVALASSCLKKNNYVSTFTTNPLYPSNSCTGGTQCTTAGCYVMSNSSVRSTFRVEPMSASATEQTITSTGTVELLRKSDATVWKTYKYVTRSAVSRDSSFNVISFGYSAIGNTGAFFGVVSPDGHAVAVGLNADGQLGNGTLTNTTTPTKIQIPANERIINLRTNILSLGRTFFATTASGTVYGSGRNTYGMLGIGTMTPAESTPKKVNLPLGEKIVGTETLYDSGFFVADSGNVYATGECAYGQLGTNYTITGCINTSTPTRVALPTVTSDPATQAQGEIVGDSYTVYVRMRGGQIYGWGVGGNGQLADGTTNNTSMPKKIGTFGDAGQPKATSVIFDGKTVYILGDNGVLYGAGSNIYLALGKTPDGGNFASITPIDTSTCGTKVRKAVTDQYHVAMIMTSGQLCVMGRNHVGQLGIGNTTSSVAVRAALPSGVSAADATVCATSNNDATNTFVIGNDGKVYGAGSNTYGQLGDGTTTDRLTFVPMNVIDGVNIVAKSVMCGGGTAVVTTTAGKIYTVGNNSNGQLGDGTTTNSSTPKANQYTNMFNIYTY